MALGAARDGLDEGGVVGHDALGRLSKGLHVKRRRASHQRLVLEQEEVAHHRELGCVARKVRGRCLGHDLDAARRVLEHAKPADSCLRKVAADLVVERRRERQPVLALVRIEQTGHQTVVEAAEQSAQRARIGEPALHGALDAHGNEVLARHEQRTQAPAHLLRHLVRHPLAQRLRVLILIHLGELHVLHDRVGPDDVDPQVLVPGGEHALVDLAAQLLALLMRQVLVGRVELGRAVALE